MKSFLLLCLSMILISTSALAQSNPVPLISQPLIPASVKPGSGALTLIVNGTGFSSSSTVNWNGSTRTTEFVSSSSLKALIKASAVANAGTASITVTNPSPGCGTSNVAFLPIRQSAPSVVLFPVPGFPSATVKLSAISITMANLMSRWQWRTGTAAVRLMST